MKNNVNICALFIGLSIFFTLNAYGQRDTINYWKGQLYLAIKDINCFPKGVSQDSIVITYNSEIDTIFKTYKVNKLLKLTDGYNNHDILDSFYQLFCNCDEYKLMDTLNKFNIQNNYKSFYIIERVPRYINDIKTNYKYSRFNLYPNPVNNNLNWGMHLRHTRFFSIFGAYEDPIQSNRI